MAWICELWTVIKSFFNQSIKWSSNCLLPRAVLPLWLLKISSKAQPPLSLFLFHFFLWRPRLRVTSSRHNSPFHTVFVWLSVLHYVEKTILVVESHCYWYQRKVTKAGFYLGYLRGRSSPPQKNAQLPPPKIPKLCLKMYQIASQRIFISKNFQEGNPRPP